VQEDSSLKKSSQDKNQNKIREHSNFHKVIKETFHSTCLPMRELPIYKDETRPMEVQETRKWS